MVGSVLLRPPTTGWLLPSLRAVFPPTPWGFTPRLKLMLALFCFLCSSSPFSSPHLSRKSLPRLLCSLHNPLWIASVLIIMFSSGYANRLQPSLWLDVGHHRDRKRMLLSLLTSSKADVGLILASKTVQKSMTWTDKTTQKSLKTMLHWSKITCSLISLHHIQLNCKCWLCTPLPRKIAFFALPRRHQLALNSLKTIMKWLWGDQTSSGLICGVQNSSADASKTLREIVILDKAHRILHFCSCCFKMQGCDLRRPSNAKWALLLLHTRCRWRQFSQKWSFCKGHSHQLKKCPCRYTLMWMSNDFPF